MRSLDCVGLGTTFAGALGLALGTVGLALGVDCIEPLLCIIIPFCIELPPCIDLPLGCEVPGLSVPGERGTLLRSLDCVGLGTTFAGALGLALGTVGSALGVEPLFRIVPFCIELPPCMGLPLGCELPGFSVPGERGTLLRSLDCVGLGTTFAGALGSLLGTFGLALGLCCIGLPLPIEPPVESVGLGMLVVVGSPPVAGTPVEGVLGDVESLCCIEPPLLIEPPVELVGLGMLVVVGSPPVAGTPVEGAVVDAPR